MDPYTIMNEPLIQIMAYIEEKDDPEFLKHLPHCKSARWTPVFADIIPEDGGKDKGIDHMIREYGISVRRSDGISGMAAMISRCWRMFLTVLRWGMPTMRVKKHAAYTTSDVLDDGIYRALVHFGVLEAEG